MLKPLIGITSSEKMLNNGRYAHLDYDNIEAMLQANAIPIILPNISEVNKMSELIDKLDGLYLSGGEDIDPLLYGESPIPEQRKIIPSRDTFELNATKRMLERQKPILGICRGCQMLNVSLAGTLYQDIYSQNKDINIIKHEQDAPLSHGTHYIKVEKNTLLYQISGQTELKVNSLHHQAIKKIGKTLKVSGVSEDQIIEAIESNDESFILGLQWHPESLTSSDNTSKKIFQGFVDACTRNKSN